MQVSPHHIAFLQTVYVFSAHSLISQPPIIMIIIINIIIIIIIVP